MSYSFVGLQVDNADPSCHIHELSVLPTVYARIHHIVSLTLRCGSQEMEGEQVLSEALNLVTHTPDKSSAPLAT